MTERLLLCVQGEALRVDVFDKVERVFLLGLRSRDPAMRQKYFHLYNSAIPVTLYDRLRFIVCNQEWEHLSDSFWLKQGLVRLCSSMLLIIKGIAIELNTHSWSFTTTCAWLNVSPLFPCMKATSLETNVCCCALLLAGPHPGSPGGKGAHQAGA